IRNRNASFPSPQRIHLTMPRRPPFTSWSLDQRNSSGYDDYQTPSYLLEPLLPHVPIDWCIWEPCAGEGNLVGHLDRKGYDYISTDIVRGDQYDFLTMEPWFDFDCVVTNPPYSNGMINAFLQRCHNLQKPYALLIRV